MARAEGQPAMPRLLLKDGIWIDFPEGDAWVLGRSSATRGEVDVDLAPHDVLRGVSRWHARIQRQQSDFVIIDLDSTNETYVNGYRLASQQAYKLADGARVGLGTLRMTFYIVH